MLPGRTHLLAPRWLLTGALLGLGLGACATAAEDADRDFLGDGSFGTPADSVAQDAGAEDDAMDAAPEASTIGGDGVRVRVFQGVLNLPNARFCHDPDYVADDPATPVDETDAGPLAPVLLKFNDAGSVAFGEATPYALLPAMMSGAITVHRGPDPDAGLAVDGGVDASAAGDAGPDGASADAGPDAAPDAANVDAGGPCDRSSMEAVLPLPVSSAWLSPDRLPDAGSAMPEKLGVVSSAINGDVLTLFGSGLSLDPNELARRSTAAKQSFLATAPGDVAGAEAEARHQSLVLDGAYGARFLFSRGVDAPKSDKFSLSLAHLVPDVPSSSQGKMPPDARSGALHLCVAIDDKESEPADGGVARIEFRQVAALGAEFDPKVSYRFRLFAESEYAGATCATASVKPIAKLEVDAGVFAPQRSYTLVASGAYAPASTCAGTNATPLVRPGCARAVDALNATLRVLPNDLPQPTP